MNAGDKVLVNPYGKPGVWVPATLMQSAAQSHRSGSVTGGWYCTFRPVPEEMWTSQGGWFPIQSIRPEVTR